MTRGMSEKEWEAKKRIKILVDELPESVLDAALEALYDLKYGKQPVQSEVDLPPAERCARCQWRQPAWRSDVERSWCYMFKERMEHCVQFKLFTQGA